ncbi:MAG TPA: hypothetical protein VH640_14085 [Bryobacteraceae bacterium]|jgi:hypothetical protein
MSEPVKPSIEERLQALAESLELMYRDQQQDAANIHSLTLIAKDALDSIKRLERIATTHQDRLDNHDQRIEDLES